jgi:hypothetical protein
MDFDTFLRKLLDNPSTQTTLRIEGQEKKIKGMARFTTSNLKGQEYFKLNLKDSTAMVISPSTQEIFVGSSLGHLTQISDDEIGIKEDITYNNHLYHLDNKDDYQYCLQVYVGNPGKDIEGECRFSDYISNQDGVFMLSLGWLMDTGNRADVAAQLVDTAEVQVI